MTCDSHPAADVFSPMDRLSPGFGDLVADIKDNGLVEPITLHEGRILDGRGRYLACREAGVEPRFEEWEGASPIAFVLSRNLHRRHLTDDQRAALAADALPMLEAEARDRQRATRFSTDRQPDRDDIKTVELDSTQPCASRRRAAAQFKVSTHKVWQAAAVRAREPELAAAVRRGELRLLEAHKRVSDRLPEVESEPPPAPPGAVGRNVIDHAHIYAESRKRLRRAHRELVGLPALSPRALVDTLSASERAELSRVLIQLVAWIPAVEKQLASYRVAPKEECP
jgi:hypothetical protein